MAGSKNSTPAGRNHQSSSPATRRRPPSPPGPPSGSGTPSRPNPPILLTETEREAQAYHTRRALTHLLEPPDDMGEPFGQMRRPCNADQLSWRNTGKMSYSLSHCRRPWSRAVAGTGPCPGRGHRSRPAPASGPCGKAHGPRCEYHGCSPRRGRVPTRPGQPQPPGQPGVLDPRPGSSPGCLAPHWLAPWSGALIWSESA